MTKYAPLRDALTAGDTGPRRMRFDEIDELVGDLPPSARRYDAWWHNEEEGSHVQARAWIDAGRRVLNVDRDAEIVVFSGRSDQRR